ncbi:MAG: sodium:solute symporter [Phycisphaerales bacterium]
MDTTDLIDQGFSAIDWLILGSYFLVLAVTGYLFSRKAPSASEDYFLGGRRMPTWAVAISVVATSLSAVTFIGAPQEAYSGNITYLSTSIGMVLAAVIIAIIFIPAFYRSGSASIYHLLEIRFGPSARKAASVSFLCGRVLASGARIYAGAIPASILFFGLENGLEPNRLILSISVLTAVGIVYTLAGGIKSVIWSDVIQFTILIGAALFAILLIVSTFNAPTTEILNQLTNGGGDGASKLQLFDLSLDPRHRYSLPACIIGFTLLGIGSYGTDQDLTQRMLTCKSAKKGAWSVISGILIGIPTTAIFLTVGLLLWIVYQRPELTTLESPPPPGESLTVFLHYILTQVPPGVRGLMMAGLFAAGLSSLNSAINAMGAAFIADIYRPMRTARSSQSIDDRHFVLAGRVAVICWGLILGAFAVVCIYWKQSENDTLIGFALSVMTFAYAGLIGVFFTALFTKRGNSTSVILALIAGFVWMLLNQRFVYNNFEFLHNPRIEYFYDIYFPWKLTMGVLISTLVCMAGSSKE